MIPIGAGPATPLTRCQLTALQGTCCTLVGFGSLLSETSARTTFPHLENFRLGRVEGYRRVFRHPAAIFYEREIAKPETLEISSLSAEAEPGCSFVVSLLDIRQFDVLAYVSREEEFDIVWAPFSELDGDRKEGVGLMCHASTDERVEERWGEGYIEATYGKYGVPTIWGWDKDSGIKPCPAYLRHCVLAAQKQGEPAYSSFLKQTFLADRKTTIGKYLESNPSIMTTLPPLSVMHRYTG